MPCTAAAAAGFDAHETRTLHPLVLEDHPHPAGPDPSSHRRGLFVDCETTGCDPERDAVIELAMLPFTYDIDGRVTDIHRDQARTWRQDPGRPVPPEITRLTGLTDMDLAGHTIDLTAADALVRSSHLIVAHNATFDRSFVEGIVPVAEDAAWACSRHEVAWDRAVFPSRSLACLLCAYGAFSPDRHRALANCEAGVWLLTQTLPGTGRTVFGELRETAAIPTVRIWAAGAPFATKDQLRRRGYRWMPADRDGIPRSWWTDVPPCNLEDEFAWLGDLYLANGRLLNPVELPRREVTAHDRWRTDPLALGC